MVEEAADALEEVFSVPVVPPLVDIMGPDYDLVRDHPRVQALIEGYSATP